MERTVPSATSDEIKLYRSTIYSLLRSNAEIKIRTIEEVHAGMNSLMHPGARDSVPDISAFIYSLLRLPDSMPNVKTVLLGQNSSVFKRNGFLDIEKWLPVSARARRRRCFFDGNDKLACYIASRSDIEDIIPALTAYQIEWNKLHFLLQRWPRDVDFTYIEQDHAKWDLLSNVLEIQNDDLQRLLKVYQGRFEAILSDIKQRELSISVRLISGSLSQYLRATHEWFENIINYFPDLTERPLYFVSSNPHSMSNLLLTGFALKHETELSEYINNSPDLQSEWMSIQSKTVRASKENFLYYILKKYQNTTEGKHLIKEQLVFEQSHGITRVPAEHTFDIEAQIIEFNKLDPNMIDERLLGIDFSKLNTSNSILLNIDYPLGLAAFNILSTVTIHTEVLGIYVMGKAASLNATRGDVLIPNVCQDEHSHNTYLFDNCFSTSDVSPFLKYGTVLDNQKAICVLGTFLQNVKIMDVFYRESFSDIEMELGNYLSALYEATRPKRYPINEIVNLYNSPIDFGVLHYVSDTPMAKGKNLGAGTLSYYGMDSTYATSIAILRRIFNNESKRLM